MPKTMDPIRDQAAGAGYLTRQDQSYLLALARFTLQTYLSRERLPEVDPAELTPGTAARACCFVTLHKGEQLRGCIGTIVPTTPLYLAVIENAISAATRDGRFVPVSFRELPGLTIEISVLTPARPVHFSGQDHLLSLLVPKKHGVILSNGPYHGLYLPQMWNYFDKNQRQKEAFLTSLSQKAGDFGGTLWMHPDTHFEVFEAVCFKEPVRGRERF